MAYEEESQVVSLKDRIAALNQQSVFNNGSGPVHKPALPPPSHAAAETRSKTATTRPVIPQRPNKPRAAPPPLPRRDTGASQGDTPKVAPPLPSRTPSAQLERPPLPSRKSAQKSHLDDRRGPSSSDVSQRSTEVRRLPPTFDHASLPPLPPTRRELEARAQEEPTQEAAKRPSIPSFKSDSIVGNTAVSQPPRPTLPPRLPSRPAAKCQVSAKSNDQDSTLKAAKVHGFGNGTWRPGSVVIGQKMLGFSNVKPSAKPKHEDKPSPIPTRVDELNPPPIPIASRPSVAQIEYVKTRAVTRTPAGRDCWACRDWSGPDGVAAQFPRQSLPRNDPVGYLARGLCEEFPSYTDKARAIFTWFHHNVVYDTVSFFGNCVKPQTVEDTIFSGLAVCQGYAETYKAIATRAGLDCLLVVGHGKGISHAPLKKGERPPPPQLGNHAWNAVRIDGGDWKLIDACWGAGHLCSSNNNLFKKEFHPQEFIKSNEEFGESHFPKDTKHQFRTGRAVTWDEYFIGRSDEPPSFHPNGHREGILESSFEPKSRNISIHSNDVIRFQFSKVCQHWESETHGLGKPPLMLLNLHGVDGRKNNVIPIKTDGYWHWIDVHARDLGAPGQSVHVMQLTSFDGEDARGLSAKEYCAKKGRVSMAWDVIMQWELV